MLEAALPSLAEAGCLGTEEIAGSWRGETEGSPSEESDGNRTKDTDGGRREETDRGCRQRAYFPPDADLESLNRELSRSFPNLILGAPRLVPDQDWLALWRQKLCGFPLGERFYVLPSWESPPPPTERIVLRIHPERAFGSGTHETTRLCLELLEREARAGAGAIDAGTGTGILAMAGAALGCRPVTAIEVDPEAASCACANLERNGLSDRVRVIAASLAQASVEPAELVMANLSESLLQEELPRLSGWVKPDGVLILSGLLQEQVERVLRLAPATLKLVERRAGGEWAALLFRRHR